MPDYNANEIVNMLLLLGECRVNYRVVTALHRQTFPRRKHHLNSGMICGKSAVNDAEFGDKIDNIEIQITLKICVSLLY